MLNKFAEIISNQLSLSYNRVLNVLKLLEEGATIPFIARYRKEMTGSMDEQNINDIDEKFNMLKDLVKRKEFILKSIEDQGELTEDLKNKIQNSYDPVEIEDLYMPFKRSNKTKAAKAREKGLEPLANYIFEQKNHDISSYANKFLNDKVPTVEDAIQGAKDIIAELISENKDIRDLVRFSFDKYAFL
ncbi:MAG TPA: RNA-binding transcriptional accessory protein, partial [Bacteroidetes bacterium]|nr:RNA-binding transcriptional accessory protein [Bacteroidota bacterium]